MSHTTDQPVGITNPALSTQIAHGVNIAGIVPAGSVGFVTQISAATASAMFEVDTVTGETTIVIDSNISNGTTGGGVKYEVKIDNGALALQVVAGTSIGAGLAFPGTLYFLKEAFQALASAAAVAA